MVDCKLKLSQTLRLSETGMFSGQLTGQGSVLSQPNAKHFLILTLIPSAAVVTSLHIAPQKIYRNTRATPWRMLAKNDFSSYFSKSLDCWRLRGVKRGKNSMTAWAGLTLTWLWSWWEVKLDQYMSCCSLALARVYYFCFLKSVLTLSWSILAV